MIDAVHQESGGSTARHAASLYRLAFLLTGRKDISVEIAADSTPCEEEANSYFLAWMRAWARRLAIVKVVAEIREELAESALRTKQARFEMLQAPDRDWSMNASEADIEEALLGIDVFPRAALLLLIFEGVRVADAAVLLDADVSLVKKGQAIALTHLTANLARNTKGPVPALIAAFALA